MIGTKPSTTHLPGIPYRYTHYIPNTPLDMVVCPRRSHSAAYRRRPSRTGQTRVQLMSFYCRGCLML
jgi:hypothetical protein